jgi:outer membrane protein assembly factor BamE (lipoprotein component of BamABCDE complex)
MRNIIVFLLLMLLSGCGFVFQNFDQGEHKQLMYGMSKEEVIRKIGEPEKISTTVIDNIKYEVWEYPNNNRSKTEKMNALGIIYSKVFFLNGKVVQRDKDRVYAQPSYEFLESANPEGGVKAAKITGQENNLK